ncbi:uncharacterized protein VTP21DRAFT_9320 [Calcarisporiella thermophila]|uniref:uncharacterized protein n=1 Tax=Calcarisporiella thermophila TaxID=911321 RepID=UPI0037446DC1
MTEKFRRPVRQTRPRPSPTLPSYSPPPKSSSNASFFRRHKGAIFFGASLYACATLATYAYVRSQQGSSERGLEKDEHEAGEVWDHIATSYDRDIGNDEFVMGIGILRWWLMRKAKGDVLEVSAGTARNLRHYTSSISSLSLTDRSPTMLEIAREKLAKSKGGVAKSAVFPLDLDLETPASLEGQFDTVVDTFGLCSCRDPGAALIRMSRLCRPSEESRVLLLEHGRGWLPWLNGVLDRGAEKHAKRWGCWWNRDLARLLEEERVQRELEVLSVSRWHFGTTLMVVARPRTTAAKEEGTPCGLKKE